MKYKILFQLNIFPIKNILLLTFQYKTNIKFYILYFIHEMPFLKIPMQNE